jgi:hypothetical protein
MAEKAGRASTRIDPETAWTVVTDSPLKGLALAREAGTILAWDEGNQLYLLNVRGESLSSSRVPDRILAGAISDEGSLIALLVEAEEARLLLLNADFAVELERPAPTEASFVSLDPHGRYVAVGARHGALSVLTRYGRPVGRVETIEPLSHWCFVPDRPLAVGAAAFGMIVGVALEWTRGGGRLDAEIVWQDRLMSNVGRLAISGDGAMILASCYTLGIQRFELGGRNEGSYHLGGTVVHAVPDFPGRSIVATTLEGDLAVMNSGGNVRWRTQLPRPAMALETDPLGRYILYGHATGEIVRLDLFGGSSGARGDGAAPKPARRPGAAPTTAPAPRAARSTAGSVRSPDWVVPAVETDQQAETAVLAVVDTPPMVALFRSPHRLQLFETTGRKLGQGPDLSGVGRLLRTAPGWLAAATDRQILLCDLRNLSTRRLDVSLVELTHLAIRPDDFGLVLVQERDRIGRLTVSSRWVWKQELRAPIEELALGPHGFVAVTTHGGQLLIFDPAGESTARFTFDPTDPPHLIEAPAGSPPGIAWVTLARRAQFLRGHDLGGQVLWERPIPWEGWSLFRLDRLALATAADGRALACDGSGALQAQSTAGGESHDAFALDPAGTPLRVSRRGVHLIAAALDGRVTWRAVVDQPLGPLACGAPGIAVLLGRSLAWFRHDAPPDLESPSENG